MATAPLTWHRTYQRLYPLAEHAQVERLRQHLHLGGKLSMFDNDSLGVACHHQGLQVGARLPRAIGDLPAVQPPGQADIGDQQDD